ncbi:hypothetical protein PGB90_000068 [Kerria lacca]
MFTDRALCIDIQVVRGIFNLTCNRTYYGDVGHTYELEIRRPREDRLPFLCFLNFTAAGGVYGDLIQIPAYGTLMMEKEKLKNLYYQDESLQDKNN